MSIFDDIAEDEWKAPKKTVFDDIAPEEWGAEPPRSWYNPLGLDTTLRPQQFKEGFKDVARSGLEGVSAFYRAGVSPQEMVTKALNKATGTNVPTPLTDTIGKPISEATERLAQKPALQPDPEMAPKNWGENFIRMLPQVGSQIVASMINPAAGVVSIGAQIAGGTYEDLVSKGVDKDKAALWGLANATMQAPLEQIGIDKALKFFKVRGTIVDLLKSAGTEFTTEWVQQYPDAFVNIFAPNPDKGLLDKTKEYLEKLPETTKEGMYQGSLTAPLSLVPGMAGNIDRRFRGQEATEQQAQPPGVTRDQILNGLVSGAITPEQAGQIKAAKPEFATEIDAALADFQSGRPNAPDIQEGPIQPIQDFAFPQQTEAEQAAMQADIEAQQRGEPERARQEAIQKKRREFVDPVNLARERNQEIIDVVDLDIINEAEQRARDKQQAQKQPIDQAAEEAIAQNTEAKRRFKALSQIWDGLSDEEQDAAIKLILPKTEPQAIAQERQAKTEKQAEEIKAKTPEGQIEAQRKLKEAERLGLKLDAQEQARLEQIAAGPVQEQAPQSPQADYGQMEKTGTWAEPVIEGPPKVDITQSQERERSGIERRKPPMDPGGAPEVIQAPPVRNGIQQPERRVLQQQESSIAGNPFQKSVVKNQVFHGTNKKFEEFNNSTSIKSTGGGEGIYFTASEKDAKDYSKGGRVIRAFVDIKNPKEITITDPFQYKKVTQFTKKQIDDFKAQGYDGVVVNFDMSGPYGSKRKNAEIVVFDKSQIYQQGQQETPNAPSTNLPDISKPRPILEHAAAGPFGIVYMDFANREGKIPTKDEIRQFLNDSGYPGSHSISKLRGGIAAKATDVTRFRVDLDQMKRYDSAKLVDELGYGKQQKPDLPKLRDTLKNLLDNEKGSSNILTDLVNTGRKKQTDTPEFKKWFGDSKVVDVLGNPIVVYHGSPDARFIKEDSIFKTPEERYTQKTGDGAYWFARDRKTAASYADDRRAFDYQNAEPGVVPAYLSLKNPLVVDGMGKEWREAQRRGKTSDVIQEAKLGGHDGVIIKNVKDNYNNNSRTKTTDTYVVFSSNQIKHSTENSGAFDPNNPSIKGSSELYNDIINKGIELKQSGVETFGRFRREMKKVFKDIWESIKVHMRELWKVVQKSPLGNQRGEVNIEREPTVDELIARLQKQADKKPETIAKQTEQKTDLTDYENVKDVWFGEKDVRELENKVQKNKLQEQIKNILGIKHYNQQARDLDKAIQIYIDLKRNPSQLSEFYGKLSPEQKKIVDLSQNLPKGAVEIADQISEMYKQTGLEAMDAGVIRNVLGNYAARKWDIPKRSIERLRKFGTTTGHAKARKFDTILEGWANGYNLKVEGATNNLQILKDEITRTIQDKKFLNTMMGLVDAEGNPLATTKHMDGYVEINHPNFVKWEPAGKAKEGRTGEIKWYGKNSFADENGNVWERKRIYAPEQVAKNLNNILGSSALNKLPGVHLITKYNAITKSWILQSSFFHHLAFMRSYYLGTNHKTWGEMSVRKAYKDGFDSIQRMDPMIKHAVKNGLTLGVQQEWTESLLQEKTAIGKILDKTSATKAIKDKILMLREMQADFLFGKFGAGLKAKAFEIEYRNQLKKHPNQNPDATAKRVANLINDDFGGLHLGRIGRNPTTQHIFRIFALAPDWTESNIRTMVKSIKAGSKEETALYRKFWAGILVKGIGATVLANFVMAGGDPEDLWKKYRRAWKEGHFRWMDIDITPVYQALGGKTKEHKYFSILGHFKDPTKFIAHPIRSAHHKGSVVYKTIHEALTGVNWAGQKFTTAKELIDEKRLTKYGAASPIGYSQFPSYILSQIVGAQPVQVQNAIRWSNGEMEAFDAISNSLGLGVSSTYSPKNQVDLRDMSPENIKQLEDLGINFSLPRKKVTIGKTEIEVDDEIYKAQSDSFSKKLIKRFERKMSWPTWGKLPKEEKIKRLRNIRRDLGRIYNKRLKHEAKKKYREALKTTSE